MRPREIVAANLFKLLGLGSGCGRGVAGIELYKKGRAIKRNVGGSGSKGQGILSRKIAFGDHEKLTNLAAGCESACYLFDFA